MTLLLFDIHAVCVELDHSGPSSTLFIPVVFVIIVLELLPRFLGGVAWAYSGTETAHVTR